ncbi:MAG TPA: hypothetical protein VHK46_08695 [Gaiellaceae bacterium]|nr:hypothetical protein [Gaiellaceae bacterium]
MRKWGLLGSLALAVLAIAPACADLGEDEEASLEVGVWEYFIRDADAETARSKLEETKAAGFRAAITNSFWEPGLREPSAQELTELRNAAEAAEEAGIRLLLIVQSPGSRTTPNTAELREEFTAYAASLAEQLPQYRDFIIGNEPNLNRFWMPQFGPNGENVAARDYLALLTESYDALKDVSSEIRVIGGALAPRGGDRPGTGRDTHSPTKFITDMGDYYRRSGRDAPVMDAFAHHPYLDNSSTPPDETHPNSTTISLGDYEKLVGLLGEAFDGTAQPGSDIPILYTEFGVQTEIPPAKQDAYENLDSPVAADAVPERTQVEYYRRAYELACEQPTVEGLYIFHVWDEPDLLGWQSGLYYADRTPKTSREALLDLPSCE